MTTRRLFWPAILLFALVTVVIFISSGEQERYFFPQDLKSIKADLLLYGLRYRRDSRDEPSQWLVVAKVARFFEKRKEVLFDQVDITFHPESERPISVQGQRGLFQVSSGNMSVEGQVLVKGFGDYILHASKLFYYPKKKTIEAPGKVVLVGRSGNKLVGKDMVYLLERHKLLLYSPRAIIKEEDVAG